MASWRTNTSQQAQSDLDSLLDAVLPYAQQALAAHGELTPMAACLQTDGKLRMMAVDLTDSAREPSLVLHDLYEGARAAADQQRAVAFVTETTTADGEPAVQIEVEHAEGIALVFTSAYSTHEFGPRICFDSLQPQSSQPHIWLR